MENMDKGVGLLSRILNLLKKYGFWKILQSMAILLVLGYVVFFALNPTYLLDRVMKVYEQRHEEAIDKRAYATKMTYVILNRLLSSTSSDRAWFIELHNGDKNLASGLTFLYGSMLSETTAEGIREVKDEYENFYLSKFPLMSDMITVEKSYIFARVEDLATCDKTLYYKLKSNDVEHIAMLTLFNANKKPLGILGLTWCSPCDTNPNAIRADMTAAGIQIASLLMP